MEKTILDDDVIELGTVVAETQGSDIAGRYDSQTHLAYLVGGIQDED